MMRPLLLLAVSLLGCDRLSAQGNADGGAMPVVAVAAWDGTYVGTWTSGEPTPGTPPPVVEYKLVVAGNYIAVTADGTQTMTRISANAVTGGTTLGATYADCKPDDMFKCRGYTKGDRLFTVTNIRGAYILRFEKLQAPDDATKEIGLAKKK